MQTLAQNLPSDTTRINWKADMDLPEGTIELRDEAGKVLGRIENIGQGPAPIEPRYAIALRLKELEGIARTLTAGKEPHCHSKPGYWDGFDPNNEVFAKWVKRGDVGPNGECYVCQARIRAQALNL